MNHANVCVWIDHREAKLFGIGLETADEATVHAASPVHHLHRKADHVHLGKPAPDQDFLKAIADHLGNARGILILGPGTAKNELAGYLHLHTPALAKCIWGIENADHPTDREIVAQAHRFFHAAGRMHA
jgi:stalled ribosome rescue protein Dom34